jgi:DNA-binding transcriptional regulator YhcF (GntR family)
LFTEKHIGAIGQAVWLFLWLVDKTTSEEIKGDERWGKVLYGNPVSAQRIADRLFVNERTVRRYLAQLEAGGYIHLERRASGFVIFVRKSMKWHTRHTQLPRTGKGQGYRENAIDRLLRYGEEEIHE